MELWRFAIGGGSGGTVDTLLIDPSLIVATVIGAAGVVEGALLVATIVGAAGVTVTAAGVVEGALLVATIVGAAGVTVTAAGVVEGALLVQSWEQQGSQSQRQGW